ncbi:hypothetical protein EVAR_21930_1 [Eumeta japonica]|uniref:Uncharacterized protein n=1 Tax=Eumeta variegata TaxID=151549 RepID=A0A4C1XGL4_EUMVA|nr:hypothetical protein EVAR_21930_1 [Eumeta japonica]
MSIPTRASVVPVVVDRAKRDSKLRPAVRADAKGVLPRAAGARGQTDLLSIFRREQRHNNHKNVLLFRSLICRTQSTRERRQPLRPKSDNTRRVVENSSVNSPRIEPDAFQFEGDAVTPPQTLGACTPELKNANPMLLQAVTTSGDRLLNVTPEARSLRYFNLI